MKDAGYILYSQYRTDHYNELSVYDGKKVIFLKYKNKITKDIEI